MLESYLPVLVFIALGAIVGSAFALLNHLVGRKRVRERDMKGDPYECGLPSEISHTFRFGVSFYMVADSVFLLVEMLIFIGVLLVGLIYVWRRGALDWR